MQTAIHIPTESATRRPTIKRKSALDRYKAFLAELKQTVPYNRFVPLLGSELTAIHNVSRSLVIHLVGMGALKRIKQKNVPGTRYLYQATDKLPLVTAAELLAFNNDYQISNKAGQKAKVQPVEPSDFMEPTPEPPAEKTYRMVAFCKYGDAITKASLHDADTYTESELTAIINALMSGKDGATEVHLCKVFMSAKRTITIESV
ncbi:hypothetical protein [Spirosoma luteum]|uniref:hypothetical protein n=1 Tax=Spirosoma luteum TaxID=431553 RepID=UPI00035D9DB3|nr:hypothetical protein [Spirosoma luteum]